VEQLNVISSFFLLAMSLRYGNAETGRAGADLGFSPRDSSGRCGLGPARAEERGISRLAGDRQGSEDGKL